MKIVLMGEPNAGKSSLLNALVGEQVSIVTDLAGTTRGQIRGFLGDLAIIDTPGMQRKKRDGNLSRYMAKSISAAVTDADVIVYVLDAAAFTDSDITKISNYRNKQPVIAAVNKTDKTNFEKLYPKLAKLNELDFIKAIVPVSAKTGYNVDALIGEIKKLMPETDIKDNEIYTDQTVRQMCAEIIRGALIKNLRSEIPHGIAVLITKFTESAKETEIHADIICEKPSHKPIIIGSGGVNLKKIGTDARAEIEKLADTHVKLFTHVIVREDWKNNREILNQLGHTVD